MIYSEYLQCPRPAKATMTPLPPTPSDIEGPFYLEGAPLLEDGELFKVRTRADKVLVVTGFVYDTDGNTLGNAMLDIWQADANGVYDEKGYQLRGKIKSNYTDGYWFQTIRPGDYQIADNPPDFRCAHIHVKVSAPGYKTLTTQLYFADDKYDSTDHWFNPKMVIGDPAGTFDFVLEKETP